MKNNMGYAFPERGESVRTIRYMTRKMSDATKDEAVIQHRVSWLSERAAVSIIWDTTREQRERGVL